MLQEISNKFCFGITGLNYILKYIKNTILNCYITVFIVFQLINVALVCIQEVSRTKFQKCLLNSIVNAIT